ncbi:MAG: hypothetical protein AB8B61_06285 [Cyclobacteriaceae bacterium]
MKKTTTILLLAILPTMMWAQGPKHRNLKESREKIETAKIGFLTSKLNLTSEQAQVFWPVYNEYSKKRFDLKKTMMQQGVKKAGDEKTEKDWSQKLELISKLRRQELDLEDKYKDEFLKVLSPKQVVKLFKAEKEFLSVLRDKITHRHEQGNQGRRMQGDRMQGNGMLQRQRRF